MKVDLTEKDVIKLRKEVPIGSLFLRDYRNTFGVDTRMVCEFFDAYLEYLGELMEEDGIPDAKFWDEIGNYDNDKNLTAWFNCYVESPLYYYEENEE